MNAQDHITQYTRNVGYISKFKAIYISRYGLVNSCYDYKCMIASVWPDLWQCPALL